jgi:nucleotide-binding universal stress UspA family protein
MDVQQAGRPVAVGVDGSESSEQAVRWAAREARRRKVPLRLVQAVDPTLPPHRYGDPGFGPDIHQIRIRAARAHLTDAARAAAVEAPGVVAEQEVLDGFTVPRLLDESRSAQLVVIGDRGLGGVAGLLLGSVAVALAARGDSPVAVVRGRTSATLRTRGGRCGRIPGERGGTGVRVRGRRCSVDGTGGRVRVA